ncbi:MAG: DUF3256 family protein [Tannerella sp.]|jgi:hypothetical protein|nr:DUF3256 family protein [Tannerella sp.]
MKRLIFSLLFVLGTFCSIIAQHIEKLFIAMPEGIIVQLEEAWRKDLADLYKSGKTATLENTMQGKSTLLKLTDNYLLLQSTGRSTVEMKLLPLVNNTHIICMITTAYAPVADSRVVFYTTDWNILPAEELYTPVTADWFLKDDAGHASGETSEMNPISDIFLVKYSLDAEKNTLTAEYTTPLYLDAESREKALLLLKDTHKVYEWRLSRFE